ncbi:DUF1499 domain-containing protein [Rhodohalobacter mucosus]|uniref:DUF1499 domain-containing protein n=1 Tax=Rhodohalobacter mucosus TaxID=2079485 RepID=A0A316TQH8_9BACT|nr:DUF1499 domain-containing protein [Rhodohalobacter mucosus]PWN05265.1 DUF1499 domain-containing protein [Rhodohalobacter mucosus]
MSVYFFLQGSRPSDLKKGSEHKYSSPLKPCPDSPNCIHHAVEYRTTPEKLFKETLTALESMNPEDLEKDSQSFQINSVFRIRLFGFKDDLKAVISKKGDLSILFIRSSSREGYSDLGVNRRRVKKLIKRLSHLNSYSNKP